MHETLTRKIRIVGRGTTVMLEKRKSKRKPIGQRAWVNFGPGSRLRPCFLRNMSDAGARLALPMAATVPQQFVLHFSPDASVGRRCEVIWQSGTEIGVAFTARLMNMRRIEYASLDC